MTLGLGWNISCHCSDTWLDESSFMYTYMSMCLYYWSYMRVCWIVEIYSFNYIESHYHIFGQNQIPIAKSMVTQLAPWGLIVIHEWYYAVSWLYLKWRLRVKLCFSLFKYSNYFMDDVHWKLVILSRNMLWQEQIPIGFMENAQSKGKKNYTCETPWV